jgi:aromatic-L-amino-acid decarboxylase
MKPDSDEFRQAARAAIEWIAAYLEDPRAFPVTPHTEPGALVRTLPSCAPEEGEPLERILDDFHRLILPAVTHWNHPRFLAYFAITACGAGVLGELLAAALNSNGMLWKTSPAGTELEQVTLGWLRRWLGLPDAFFGIIFDTASVSTFHAIAAARQQAAPEIRDEGGGAGLTLYCSEQAHSSVDKAAIALGIGLRNVRKIPTDAEFRMCPEQLDAAIAEDRRRGRRPFCVVATVGTTSTTSVDPLAAIAAIAGRHGLWLHVDAAYAGAAAILPEYRHILAGAEHADSIVVNPHKWLLTPMDLSAFYTRRPHVLRAAFSLVPEYLRTEPDAQAVNYMDYSLPLGRRFRALKLWFVMRHFGRRGIERVLRSHIHLAQELARRIDADPRFERVAPAPFSVVCFRLRGGDEANRRLLDEVNATGRAFLSHTVLGGRFVLRLAIGNLGTTMADLEEVWGLVQEKAARLRETEPSGYNRT